MMALPFTAGAFFEVFAQYNVALWPAVIGLWLAAAVALVAVMRAPGPGSSAFAAGVLIALWLWAGLAYHATYFTRINPAAWGFAGLFVVEAGLLAWYGPARRRLAFGAATGLPKWVGVGLALYALAYPALNVVTGHAYPATPTFGVPCPTTILTAGLLLMCRRPPLGVAVVPILWSLIGGSAAVLLGVAADYVLLACAPILAANAAGGRRAR